jgi:hypothetical protein
MIAPTLVSLSMFAPLPGASNSPPDAGLGRRGAFFRRHIHERVPAEGERKAMAHHPGTDVLTVD